MQEGTCWASLRDWYLSCCGTGRNKVSNGERETMFSNIREHTWPGHWLYIWSDLQRLSHAKYPLTSGPLQLATLSARNSTFWLTHTLHSLDRPFSAVLNLFKPYSLFLYPALISMVALELPHIILSFYVLYFSLLIQPSTLHRRSITVEIFVCLVHQCLLLHGT